MIKRNICLYTPDRTSLSLGCLRLKKYCFIEDIFNSVADAKTFDELTCYLKLIIEDELVVDRVTNKWVRYKVIDSEGNFNFLKVKIKLEN